VCSSCLWRDPHQWGIKGQGKAIHNKIILDLLFDLAAWHTYAKLCLHTDDTLAFFDSATVALGQSICKFQCTVCKHYHTMDLPHEHAAHGRQQAALASKQPGASHTVSGPKVKRLNLNTYKYHALADYPNTIRERGTTDSFNSQLVCTSLVHLLLSSNVPPGRAWTLPVKAPVSMNTQEKGSNDMQYDLSGCNWTLGEESHCRTWNHCCAEGQSQT